MSAHGKDTRTGIPRTIRKLAVPIILIWVAFTAATNLLVPRSRRSAWPTPCRCRPRTPPAVIAAKRMGEKFQESTSDSIAMVVLVGDEPLGESAREYYRTLVGKFQADKKHVQHVQDFWGDMITAAGVQSSDGKAAYVQLNLAGDQGGTEGNHSVRRSADHPRDTPATGRARLRHRSGAAHHGLPGGQRQRHDQDDRGHHDRHHDHAGTGLPVGQHGSADPGHRGHRDGRLPGPGRGGRTLRADGLLDLLRPADDGAGHRRRDRLRDLPYSAGTTRPDRTARIPDGVPRPTTVWATSSSARG